MTDEQLNRLVEAVHAHGDQLGGNLVYLKAFLERLRQDDRTFLAEQRAASEAAQSRAHWTAIFSAFAAGAAAVAAMVQAYAAFEFRELQNANPVNAIEITAPPKPQSAAAPG